MSEPSRTSLRIGGSAERVRLSLVVDGVTIEARAGESVATALLAAGRRALRASPRLRLPRGMFCAMGVCQECVVEIDGRLRTSCTTPVRGGMRVVTRWPDDV